MNWQYLKLHFKQTEKTVTKSTVASPTDTQYLLLLMASAWSIGAFYLLFWTWWCTHTRQSVSRQGTFDPQSPVCLASVSALFRTQAWHALSALARLEEVASAQYGCTCTGTERRHRCNCLRRILLKFRQTTAYKVQIKSGEKIHNYLLDHRYQRTIKKIH